jgi:hypothetical protein
MAPQEEPRSQPGGGERERIRVGLGESLARAAQSQQAKKHVGSHQRAEQQTRPRETPWRHAPQCGDQHSNS